MEKIASVLPKTFEKLGLQKRFRSEMILYRWAEIVGSDIAQHTRPVSIQFGLLFVAVNNPVWMHHLSLMKEKLIHQINGFAQMKVITELKFQAGAVKITTETDNEQPLLSINRKIRDIILTHEEVAEIRNLTSEVKSEGLRQRLFSLLVKEHRLKKYKLSHSYHPCPTCGTLCSEDESECFVCSLQSKNQRIETLRNFLFDAPWMTYQDCRQFIAASEFEYNKAKERFVQSLVQKLQQPISPPLIEETIVMLMTGAKPDQLTKEMIEKIMSRVRRKKYVFASRQ